MKKFISILMAMLIIMSITCVSVNAETDDEPDTKDFFEYELSYTQGRDTWTYVVKPDDTIEIERYEGYNSSARVPEEINGKAVTSITRLAFNTQDGIENVYIPKTVTSISKGALKQYYIYKVFVDEDNPVYSSIDGALYNKDGTVLIEFPMWNMPICYTVSAGTLEIGSKAFQYCVGVEEVTICDGLKKIDDRAFYYCGNLEKIIIPESVTEIEKNAFGSNAKNFTICGYEGSEAERYAIENGIKFEALEKEVIEEATEETTDDEPDFEYEMVYAQGRDTWTYVVKPDDTIEIRKYKGWNRDCDAIVPEEINGKAVTSVAKLAFDTEGGINDVYIPKTVTSISKSALKQYRIGKVYVDENNPVYSSRDGALYNKDGTVLLELPIWYPPFFTVPDGTLEIDSEAFQYCSGIEEITLCDGLKKIDDKAFYCCSNLEKIIIPESVTEIGKEVFVSNSNVFTIYGYEGSEAERYAIENGIKFKVFDEDSTEPEDVIEYELSYTQGRDTWSYVVKPDDTIEIRRYEGYDTDARVPEEIKGKVVTSVGKNAFNTDGLENVYIPKTVTSISKGALKYYYIYEVFVDEDNPVYSSRDGALYNKDGTVLLELPMWNMPFCYSVPDGTLEIGSKAFQYCIGVLDVTICDGLKKIDDEAFYYCRELEKIIIPESVTEIEKKAFGSNAKNFTICGYEGSEAERYAIENGIKFEALEKETTTITTTQSTTEATTTTTKPTTEATTATTPVVVETKTYYFTNNKDWSEVYAYFWKDKGGDRAMWPGQQLSKVGTNDMGQDVYSVTIDTSNYDMVIFNNYKGEQSVNIKVTDYTTNAFYLKDTKKDYGLEVGTWNYIEATDATTTEATEATTTTATEATTNVSEATTSQTPETTRRVWYRNDDNWSAVRIYAYYMNGTESVKMTSWDDSPLMTKDGQQNSKDMYYYDLSTQYTTVIFVSNSKVAQTVNVTLDDTNNAYYPTTKDDSCRFDVTAYNYNGEQDSTTKASESATQATTEAPATTATEATTEATTTTVTEPATEATATTATEPATEAPATTATELATETVTTPTQPVSTKTSISLAKSSAKLYATGTTKIKATIKNPVGKTSYISSNNSVVSVDKNGKLIAKGKGKATITIINNGVKKSFKVTVINPSLKTAKKNIKKGHSFALKVKGAIGKVKYISQNKSVVKVSKNGKITAKRKGSAVIKVIANGVTLKCKVCVR